jgi:malonyl CoA-acyl carrier protein transacylase
MAVVCLFPGQGSQSKGMGGDLFDRFADWTDAADRRLGYSIRVLCLDDPRGELGQTRFTQPALFVVNAMTYRAREEAGRSAPAFLAGHSLGEYNALVAASVFDFATGLDLVARRGALMGAISGGGMAAVIGLDPDRIAELLATSEAGRRLDVANFNSFDQTVIAGGKEDLTAVKGAFQDAGGRFIPLKVSAPFHSRYMQAPMQEFGAHLESVAFAQPQVPVVSNVTGRPYEAARLRETLARQIGQSVRWLDSVLYMLDHGATEFEEVGPGTVLMGLVGKIRDARARAGR